MAAPGNFAWNSELPSGRNPFWVRDEALAGLGLHAGDAVSVDTRAEPRDGDLVVAEVELEDDSLRTARRYRPSGDRAPLPPERRPHPTRSRRGRRHPDARRRSRAGDRHGRHRCSSAVCRRGRHANRRAAARAVGLQFNLMDIGSFTDVGRVREGNEDALLVVEAQGQRAGQVVVAVADGMGGHNAGEVASALAVDALRRTVEEAEPGLEPDALLTNGVSQGNRAIWDAAAEDVAKDGMGTTVVCALLDESGTVVVANVGDSRAYAYLGGKVHQVTTDHTWVNEQVLAGYLSPADARTSPFRNLLTRTLGNSPRVDVDLFTGLHLEAGDGLILVSDGVTGYLDEADLAAALQEADSAQAAAERLVNEAVERGGADNATAVVVRR